MHPGQTSDDLLAHFDRPQTVDLPDFDWVDEALTAEPSTTGIAVDDKALQVVDLQNDLSPTERRGVGWVLKWTAATAVLVVAAGFLSEFAYLVVAEHRLTVAARAGALEATLPRATYQTVTTTIARRLAGYPELADQLRINFVQNGLPTQQPLRQHAGDRFTVELTAPKSAAVPRWLSAVGLWRNDRPVHASSERPMPGRKLPLPKLNQTAAE